MASIGGGFESQQSCKLYCIYWVEVTSADNLKTFKLFYCRLVCRFNHTTNNINKCNFPPRVLSKIVNSILLCASLSSPFYYSFLFITHSARDSCVALFPIKLRIIFENICATFVGCFLFSLSFNASSSFSTSSLLTSNYWTGQPQSVCLFFFFGQRCHARKIYCKLLNGRSDCKHHINFVAVCVIRRKSFAIGKSLQTQNKQTQKKIIHCILWFGNV